MKGDLDGLGKRCFYSELLILKDSRLALNRIYGVISNFTLNYCFKAVRLHIAGPQD